MGELPPASSPGSSVSCRCYFCGTEHPVEVRFCTGCKRYQPDRTGDRPTVTPCRVCRELIPQNALRCNHCTALQHGIGSWLPTSAATLAALGAVVSTLALLINTIAAHPPAQSRTTTALVDYGPDHLYVRISNSGTRASFVGTGWFTLTSDPTCPATLCPAVGAVPPEGVLELRAQPLDSALIEPGHKVMDFIRTSGFDRTTNRPPIPCDSFREDRLPRLKACLAFEVIEHQSGERRCVPLSISNLSATHYLQFVEQAVAASCGGSP